MSSGSMEGRNVPLIIPLSSARRGWKPAERTISDVPPIIWNNKIEQQQQQQQDEEQDDDTPHGESFSSVGVNRRSYCCGVCKKRESRYTCPRCKVHYCSIECYNNHSSSTSSSSTLSCTEDFYKDKVSVHMKLESLEQQAKTRRILNRYHHHQHHSPLLHGSLFTEEEDDRTGTDKGFYDIYDDDDDDNDEVVKDGELSLVDEEALYGVLSKLERLEKDDDDDGKNNNYTIRDDCIATQILNNLLPPSLKLRFDKDLRDGTIQDLLLERWYPWWRKELISKEDLDEEEEENGVETIKQITTTKLSSRYDNNTLDGKLLKVPDFGGLHKGGSSLSSTQQEMLLFNLIEILYATCWTLRLYHGLVNASTNEPVEAATTLVAASTVLGRDERFVDLSQVLTHCTSSSTGSYGRYHTTQPQQQQKQLVGVGCNCHWTVLVEDVALLVSTHRTVGRTLLEASDMLKCACKELKSRISTAGEKGRYPKGDDSTIHTNLRLIRKKVQYFLSWTQYTTTRNLFGDHLKGTVLAWKDERMTTLGTEQYDNDPGVNKETVMQSFDLQLPSTTWSLASKHAQKDLAQCPSEIQIVEVQSRRLQ
jgi:hypothetical protein